MTTDTSTPTVAEWEALPQAIRDQALKYWAAGEKENKVGAGLARGRIAKLITEGQMDTEQVWAIIGAERAGTLATGKETVWISSAPTMPVLPTPAAAGQTALIVRGTKREAEAPPSNESATETVAPQKPAQRLQAGVAGITHALIDSPSPRQFQAVVQAGSRMVAVITAEAQ